MHRITLPLVALALLIGAAACASAQLDDGPPELHILLTNDDGIDAVGLQTLKEALRDAGHRVTVAAPASNQSGKSAAISFGALKVEERGPGEYAIDATPATCAMFGMSALADPEAPFDLLVSGTNHGANAGGAASVSGTVGATTVAALGLGGGLPAIAVSTDPITADTADDAFGEHFENVAGFAVRLIDALQRSAGGDGLIPPGVRLNVNYPAREPEDIKGVRVAPQGGSFGLGVSFEEQVPGVWAPRLGRAPRSSGTASPDGDATLHADGWITIAPLDTDQTAPAPVLHQLRRRLANLPVRDPEEED